MYLLKKQNTLFNYTTLVVGFLLVFVFTIPLHAQTKRQLESKRKKLQLEIKKINKLLSKTKKNEKTVLSQLDDINTKMNVYQDMIHTIEKESEIFSTEINKNNSEITQIEQELSKLKKAYSQSVVNQYKSRGKNNRLLFLLSSKDFLQAYKRLAYMEQISSYRKKQAEKINAKKIALLKLNDSIFLKKKVKDSLIILQKKGKKAISTEKIKQEKLLSKVKKQEKKYLNQILSKQKKDKEYNKKIKKIITTAMHKSNRSSKESVKLASSFVKNKGKLPAPVEKGYVSRYFGTRKHEVMKKISIKSSGWHYTTAKKAYARSVFKGMIIAITVDKKTKIKTVIIQHGRYMTVYGNLEKLLVKEGDKVKTKQKLGVIHTNATTEKTILKFALWKDAKPQDPKAWML